MKEGEGTSQRTCKNDPWPWTTVWWLTVGVAGGLGGGVQTGKNGDNCNGINIKVFFKKKYITKNKERLID